MVRNLLGIPNWYPNLKPWPVVFVLWKVKPQATIEVQSQQIKSCHTSIYANHPKSRCCPTSLTWLWGFFGSEKISRVYPPTHFTGAPSGPKPGWSMPTHSLQGALEVDMEGWSITCKGFETRLDVSHVDGLKSMRMLNRKLVGLSIPPKIIPWINRVFSIIWKTIHFGVFPLFLETPNEELKSVDVELLVGWVLGGRCGGCLIGGWVVWWCTCFD